MRVGLASRSNGTYSGLKPLMHMSHMYAERKNFGFIAVFAYLSYRQIWLSHMRLVCVFLGQLDLCLVQTYYLLAIHILRNLFYRIQRSGAQSHVRTLFGFIEAMVYVLCIGSITRSLMLILNGCCESCVVVAGSSERPNRRKSLYCGRFKGIRSKFPAASEG